MSAFPKTRRGTPYKRPLLWSLGRLHLHTFGQGTGNADGSSGMGLPNMGMTMSDRRAKTAVIRLGRLVSGLSVYLFQYLPEFQDRYGDGIQLGFMADEVERIMPGAVAAGDDGLLRVDYRMLWPLWSVGLSSLAK